MINTKKIRWFCVIAAFITNIAFYPFLPNRIAIHFDATMTPNRFAPKPVALLILPVVLLLLNLIYNNDEERSRRMLLVSIIFLLVNVGVNIFNLVISR